MALFTKKTADTLVKGKSADSSEAAASASNSPVAAPDELAVAAVHAPDTARTGAPEQMTFDQQSAFALSALLSLGEIISLMMRSPSFFNVPLGAIAAMVAPALGTGQFIVARAQTKEGAVSPVGACLWAMVSPDVDARLSANLEQPIKLEPDEWRGGDIPWAVVLVGDQRVLGPMLRQMQKENLGGKGLRMRVRTQDGATKVHVFDATSDAAVKTT